MPYVDRLGKVLTSRVDIIKDILTINLSLDINDVPFKEFGIKTSIEEGTEADLMQAVRQSLDLVLSNNGLSSDVVLNGLKIEDGAVKAQLTIADSENIEISLNS